MSNAIANSFALLNEIRQELNQTKTTNLRNISKSPSPKKNPLSTLTAPLRAKNINNATVEIPVYLNKLLQKNNYFCFII
jgi:hypothetical protein